MRGSSDCSWVQSDRERGGELCRGRGVYISMRRQWTLRQLLATVRGIGFMLALFWVFMGIQFVPWLLRGGLEGMRQHLDQVATAGVPPEQWPVAITHMREALAVLAGCLVLTVVLQRHLSRRMLRNS